MFFGFQKEKKEAYPIKPAPFTSVHITDKFWGSKIRRNFEVTIPIAIDQCYKTGRVDNLLFVGKIKQGSFCGQYPFDDTEIYKLIEAASYSLQTIPDKKVKAHIDTFISWRGTFPPRRQPLLFRRQTFPLKRQPFPSGRQTSPLKR